MKFKAELTISKEKREYNVGEIITFKVRLLESEWFSTKVSNEKFSYFIYINNIPTIAGNDNNTVKNYEIPAEITNQEKSKISIALEIIPKIRSDERIASQKIITVIKKFQTPKFKILVKDETKDKIIGSYWEEINRPIFTNINNIIKIIPAVENNNIENYLDKFSIGIRCDSKGDLFEYKNNIATLIIKTADKKIITCEFIDKNSRKLIKEITLEIVTFYPVFGVHVSGLGKKKFQDLRTGNKNIKIKIDDSPLQLAPSIVNESLANYDVKWNCIICGKNETLNKGKRPGKEKEVYFILKEGGNKEILCIFTEKTSLKKSTVKLTLDVEEIEHEIENFIEVKIVKPLTKDVTEKTPFEVKRGTSIKIQAKIVGGPVEEIKEILWTILKKEEEISYEKLGSYKYLIATEVDKESEFPVSFNTEGNFLEPGEYQLLAIALDKNKTPFGIYDSIKIMVFGVFPPKPPSRKPNKITIKLPEKNELKKLILKSNEELLIRADTEGEYIKKLYWTVKPAKEAVNTEEFTSYSYLVETEPNQNYSINLPKLEEGEYNLVVVGISEEGNITGLYDYINFKLITKETKFRILYRTKEKGKNKEFDELKPIILDFKDYLTLTPIVENDDISKYNIEWSGTKESSDEFSRSIEFNKKLETNKEYKFYISRLQPKDISCFFIKNTDNNIVKTFNITIRTKQYKEKKPDLKNIKKLIASRIESFNSFIDESQIDYEGIEEGKPAPLELFLKFLQEIDEENIRPKNTGLKEKDFNQLVGEVWNEYIKKWPKTKPQLRFNILDKFMKPIKNYKKEGNEIELNLTVGEKVVLLGDIYPKKLKNHYTLDIEENLALPDEIIFDDETGLCEIKLLSPGKKEIIYLFKKKGIIKKIIKAIKVKMSVSTPEIFVVDKNKNIIHPPTTKDLVIRGELNKALYFIPVFPKNFKFTINPIKIGRDVWNFNNERFIGWLNIREPGIKEINLSFKSDEIEIPIKAIVKVVEPVLIIEKNPIQKDYKKYFLTQGNYKLSITAKDYLLFKPRIIPEKYFSEYKIQIEKPQGLIGEDKFLEMSSQTQQLTSKTPGIKILNYTFIDNKNNRKKIKLEINVT
ncbi:hypothetical protein HYU23_03855 [Candidatus Woesearchaeota archaeon]|nr:hypothetical protein [Candidatus Woesearchaeota archaeon]